MSASEPTVSVVLPTYNRAEYLRDAIDSVLQQSYTDFELLVVDDGSTDRTKGVVEGIKDPRVRYLVHETNKGAAAARNTGIEAARGAFLGFQASDDKWHQEKLAKQMRVFAEAPPDVGVVYTGSWEVKDGVKTRLPSEGVDPKEGDIREPLSRHNFIPTEAAVVRRECFDVVGGFDERLPRLQDWEIWLRIAERYRFRYIDEPLLTSHILEDSITNDLEKLSEARKRIVEKHQDRFRPEILAVQLWRTGHASLKCGEVDSGRRYLFRAIRTNPRPLYIVSFVLALFGSAVYSGVYNGYKAARA